MGKASEEGALVRRGAQAIKDGWRTMNWHECEAMASAVLDALGLEQVGEWCNHGQGIGKPAEHCTAVEGHQPTFVFRTVANEGAGGSA